MVPKLYKLIFGKKKVNLQHTVYFACSSCGWEGHISKFGTRCPKCDAPASLRNFMVTKWIISADALPNAGEHDHITAEPKALGLPRGLYKITKYYIKVKKVM